MNTFLDIQDWVLSEVNDTSTAMRTKVKRYINTILQDEYLGCEYSWNLNATTWSITSGVSTVALPSLMSRYNVENFMNLSYSNAMQPAGKRKSFQLGSNTGVVEYYWRQGDNFVFNAAGSNQFLYFEWFPQHASLVASDDIPLIPNKQILAEGALWMAWDRSEEQAKAARQEQRFWGMIQRDRDADSVELVDFEDPYALVQRG